MAHTLDWLEALALDAGLGSIPAGLLAQGVVILGLVLMSFAAHFVVRRFLLSWVSALIRRTENQWDDTLVQHRVVHRLAHLAPAVVIHAALPLAFPTSESLQNTIRHVAIAYMILVGCLMLDGLLSALSDIYHRLEVARTRPLKTYIQVLKLVLYVVTSILVLSTLLQRSPWGFLTGLGAMTAVLLLVFKDTILGFVASVQLTGQDLVRVGDWIEMPKYGADGDVIDVSINTIKVRNWDKTVTTIPTYALVSDSFKNWRGMTESGGRRIKRALRIDMTSVRFCDEALLERFEHVSLLADYIRDKRQELARYNAEQRVDSSVPVNGRRLTNLGSFRAYLIAYLRKHPKIHQGLTFLVRQLEPDAEGIPLEIYVFSADQAWANYESLQADIFDHVLAALPEFELRVFQNPSGADIRSIAHAMVGSDVGSMPTTTARRLAHAAAEALATIDEPVE